MASTQTAVNQATAAMVTSTVDLINFDRALKAATASLGDLAKQAKPAAAAKSSGVSADLQQLITDLFGKTATPSETSAAASNAAKPAAGASSGSGSGSGSGASSSSSSSATPPLEQLINQLIAAIFNKGKASPSAGSSATPAAGKTPAKSPLQTAIEQVVADIFNKAKASPGQSGAATSAAGKTQAAPTSLIQQFIDFLLGKKTADASKPAASNSAADKASPGSSAEQEMVKLLQQVVDELKGKTGDGTASAGKPAAAAAAPDQVATPPSTRTLPDGRTLTTSGVDPVIPTVLTKPAPIELDSTPPQLATLSSASASAAASIESAWQNTFKGAETALTSLVTTGKVNFKSLADSIISDILRMAMQALIEGPILKMLGIGGPAAAGAGAGAGALTGAGDLMSSFFAFAANGGVMTSAGMLPLQAYSSGGVARSPQLAVFGEGRTPEAYVPLPDGRSIPVSMKTNGAGSTTAGGHTFNTSVVVNSDGSSTVSGADQGRQFAKVVQAAIRQELLNQRRDGGILSSSPTGTR